MTYKGFDMCIRSIVFFLLSLSSLLGIAQELKQGESGSLLRIESFPAASKNDNPKLFCPLALLINGGSGKIVVKNISPSKILQNIRTTFSSSGDLTTYVTESTDCPTSLQPGASCNFIYTPNGTPFPSGTTFVSGSFKILADGTVGLSTGIIISSLPEISFSGSATTTSIIDVSNGSTTLTVSNNNTTAFHAKDVTVNPSPPSGCPTVTVDASQCTDIAPGSSCPLTLTTGVSGTPYTPCTLTITGSNTSNSITALVAFRDMGGLVYATSGLCNTVPASEKIAFVNTFEQFFSEWTLFTTTNGATDPDDGLLNTAIINADPNCNSYQGNCAAFMCSNSGWYLPAINELTEIHNSLCSNNAFPCNFGTFDAFPVGSPPYYYYWSSTVVPADVYADILVFPSGTFATLYQQVKAAIVCSQCFP